MDEHFRTTPFEKNLPVIQVSTYTLFVDMTEV